MDRKNLRKILNESDINNILNLFKNGLIEYKIKPRYVILFGSYAKSKQHIDSDIDVAVVVRNSDKDMVKRNKTDLLYLASQTHFKLEPHFMTENDFNNKYLSLPAEIKKYGIMK